MNMIRKIFCLSFFSVVLFFSCVNLKSVLSFNQQKQNLKKVEFVEIRRLNASSGLKESTVVKTTKEIKELYKKLNDSKYSRSAPIPVLENESEFFLVLKPRMKTLKNGDIEVEKIESDGSTLWVTYKEVENDEYKENKQLNPILIIKILNKPQKIKLNLIH